MLFHCVKLNPQAVRSTETNALRRLHEVRSLRLRDVIELLRIAVGPRELGALNLNHDPTTRSKSMRNVRQPELNVIRLIRFEGQLFLKALAVLATERRASNQLLTLPG